MVYLWKIIWFGVSKQRGLHRSQWLMCESWGLQPIRKSWSCLEKHCLAKWVQLQALCFTSLCFSHIRPCRTRLLWMKLSTYGNVSHVECWCFMCFNDSRLVSWKYFFGTMKQSNKSKNQDFRFRFLCNLGLFDFWFMLGMIIFYSLIPWLRYWDVALHQSDKPHKWLNIRQVSTLKCMDITYHLFVFFNHF